MTRALNLNEIAQAFKLMHQYGMEFNLRTMKIQPQEDRNLFASLLAEVVQKPDQPIAAEKLGLLSPRELGQLVSAREVARHLAGTGPLPGPETWRAGITTIAQNMARMFRDVPNLSLQAQLTPSGMTWEQAEQLAFINPKLLATLLRPGGAQMAAAVGQVAGMVTTQQVAGQTAQRVLPGYLASFVGRMVGQYGLPSAQTAFQTAQFQDLSQQMSSLQARLPDTLKDVVNLTDRAMQNINDFLGRRADMLKQLADLNKEAPAKQRAIVGQLRDRIKQAREAAGLIKNLDPALRAQVETLGNLLDVQIEMAEQSDLKPLGQEVRSQAELPKMKQRFTQLKAAMSGWSSAAGDPTRLSRRVRLARQAVRLGQTLYDQGLIAESDLSKVTQQYQTLLASQESTLNLDRNAYRFMMTALGTSATTPGSILDFIAAQQLPGAVRAYEDLTLLRSYQAGRPLERRTAERMWDALGRAAQAGVRPAELGLTEADVNAIEQARHASAATTPAGPTVQQRRQQAYQAGLQALAQFQDPKRIVEAVVSAGGSRAIANRILQMRQSMRPGARLRDVVEAYKTLGELSGQGIAVPALIQSSINQAYTTAVTPITGQATRDPSSLAATYGVNDPTTAMLLAYYQAQQSYGPEIAGHLYSIWKARMPGGAPQSTLQSGIRSAFGLRSLGLIPEDVYKNLAEEIAKNTKAVSANTQATAGSTSATNSLYSTISSFLSTEQQTYLQNLQQQVGGFTGGMPTREQVQAAATLRAIEYPLSAGDQAKMEAILGIQRAFGGRIRRNLVSGEGSIFDEFTFGGYSFRVRSAAAMLTGAQQQAMQEYLQQQRQMLAVMSMTGMTAGPLASTSRLAALNRMEIARQRFGEGVSDVWAYAGVPWGNRGLGVLAGILGPSLLGGFAAYQGVGLIAGLGAEGSALAGLSAAAGPIGLAALGGIGLYLTGAYVLGQAQRWYQQQDPTLRGIMRFIRLNQLYRQAGGARGPYGAPVYDPEAYAKAESIIGREEEAYRPGNIVYEQDQFTRFAENTLKASFEGVAPERVAGLYMSLAQLTGMTPAAIRESSQAAQIYRHLQAQLTSQLPIEQILQPVIASAQMRGYYVGPELLDAMNRILAQPWEERYPRSLYEEPVFGALRRTVMARIPFEADTASLLRLAQEVGPERASELTLAATQLSIERLGTATIENVEKMATEIAPLMGRNLPADFAREEINLKRGYASYLQGLGLIEGTPEARAVGGILSSLPPEQRTTLVQQVAQMRQIAPWLNPVSLLENLRVPSLAVQRTGLGVLQNIFGRFGLDVSNLSSSLLSEMATPQGQRILQEMAGPQWLFWSTVARQGGRFMPERLPQQIQRAPVYYAGGYEVSPWGVIQPLGQTTRDFWQWNIRGAEVNWNVYAAGRQLELHDDFVELTHSLRGLEDAMTAEEKRYEGGQAGRATDNALRQYRQAMENLEHQYRVFRIQTAWQREEFGIQAQRMAIQQGWQRENMAYQQAMAGLQYGWGLEDITRNIRFASGQQRAQLLRQRERMMISYAMEEGQRSRERSRMETQFGWASEDLERQRQHFEVLTQLQEEYFDMQRRHLTENLAAQLGAINAEAAHAENMRSLQQAARNLQRTYQDKELEWRKEELKHQQEMAAKAKKQYEDELTWWIETQKATKAWQDMITAGFATPDGTLYASALGWINALEDEFWRRVEQLGGKRGNPPPSGQTMPPSSGENVLPPPDSNLPPPWTPGDNYNPINGPTSMSINIYLGDKQLSQEIIKDIAVHPAFGQAVNQALNGYRRNRY